MAKRASGSGLRDSCGASEVDYHDQFAIVTGENDGRLACLVACIVMILTKASSGDMGQKVIGSHDLSTSLTLLYKLSL